MMSVDRLKIFAERRAHSDRIDLHISERAGPGRIGVARPLVFDGIEEGLCFPASPAVSLTLTEAQMLMDELWNAGLRPSEGSGSAGAMAATERHLKDMQTIAMGLLKGEF